MDGTHDGKCSIIPDLFSHSRRNDLQTFRALGIAFLCVEHLFVEQI
jgi:hypothetical protein